MLFPFGHILRLARAGFVLARDGVFSDIDITIMPAAARLPLFLAKLIARRDKGPSLTALSGCAIFQSPKRAGRSRQGIPVRYL